MLVLPANLTFQPLPGHVLKKINTKHMNASNEPIIKQSIVLTQYGSFLILLYLLLYRNPLLSEKKRKKFIPLSLILTANLIFQPFHVLTSDADTLLVTYEHPFRFSYLFWSKLQFYKRGLTLIFSHEMFSGGLSKADNKLSSKQKLIKSFGSKK